MKKCPYCAEEIQTEAIKCKHCGEFLEEKTREKWYFRTNWMVIAFLCVGPLALPMLWFNPRFSRRKKIVISVIVLILSYYLTVVTLNSLKTLDEYYKQMSQVLNEF